MSATNHKTDLPQLAPVALGELSRVLKVLADETRLRILGLLLKSECCVCQVVDELALSQPLVSHHLRLLKVAGIIRDRRDAQWVYYSVDPETLIRLGVAFSALFGVARLPPEARYGAAHRC